MDEMIHLNVSSTKLLPAIQQVLESQTEEIYSQTLAVLLYPCLGK